MGAGIHRSKVGVEPQRLDGGRSTLHPHAGRLVSVIQRAGSPTTGDHEIVMSARSLCVIPSTVQCSLFYALMDSGAIPTSLTS